MPSRTPRVSAARARAIAIHAQGLDRPAVERGIAGRIGAGRMLKQIAALGLLQIDSVNVFERAHYLPLFSRLGAYDKSTLLALNNSPKRGLFEYWAHEAALLPESTWGVWEWRRNVWRTRPGEYYQWYMANQEFVGWLLDFVRDRGPTAASDIEHERNHSGGTWWAWSDVKLGLEWLIRTGDLATAGRRNFQRYYAAPEQVISAESLNASWSDHDSLRLLIDHAARAHGIATLGDIADYFRISTQRTRPIVEELVEEGALAPIAVEGWPAQTYMHRDAARVRSSSARAILSPFDPLVWYRPRTERLFGFHYRIEIYTPAHKRQYGYYTLPFVLGDAVVGRVDLKADRQTGRLLVQAAWHEEGAPADTAAHLALSLREAAAWQGLDSIVVAERGNLAAAVRAEVNAIAP